MDINIHKNNHVRAQDIAPYRSDIEGADKIYFWGWRNNAVDEHVRPKNLDKTKKLLGVEAYNFSKKHNVSTKWTEDKSLAKDFYYIKIGQ